MRQPAHLSVAGIRPLRPFFQPQTLEPRLLLSSSTTINPPFDIEALIPQGNNAVIAVGFNDSQLEMQRYFTSGSNADTLDTSFGPDHNGTVVTDAGDDAAGYSIAIDSSGNIFIAGDDYTFSSSITLSDWVVAKYNSSGDLDDGTHGTTAWGDDGDGVDDLATLPGTFSSPNTANPLEGSPYLDGDTNQSDNTAYGVAIEPNSSGTPTVIISGTSDPTGSHADFAVMAIRDDNGQAATSFNSGQPEVLPDFSGNTDNHGGRVAIDSQGRIVVAGSSDGQVAVARLNPTGGLDTSFNGTGEEIVGGGQIFTDNWDVGLAVQSNDQIVVGSRDYNDWFAVIRLNTNGTLDTSFGNGGSSNPQNPTPGIEAVGFSNTTLDDVDDISVQPGGQILVAGTAEQIGSNDTDTILTALAVLNSNGSVDTSADSGGLILSDPITVSTDSSDAISPDFGEVGGFAAGASFASLGQTGVVAKSDRMGYGNAGSSTVNFLTNETDNTPPTAALASTSVTATGATVDIQYHDNVAVSLATIGSSNLTISGPGGTLTIGTPTFVSSDSASPEAAYPVSAPGGSWGIADDGTYTITINANQVKDTSGNAVATATLGTFTVSAAGYASGIVFNDANQNGTQDSGETGAAGVTVYLDANNNGMLDSGETTATTDANGNFVIGGLTNGTYNLRILPPAGDEQTTPASDGAFAITVSGQNVSGVVFGIAPASTATGHSISGTVFNDANGNGAQDAGETAFAGATVYIDTNGNGTLDPGEPTTQTDSTGAFSFTGVADGSYTVRVVPPSGYAQTDPAAGAGDPATVSAANVSGLIFGLHASSSTSTMTTTSVLQTSVTTSLPASVIAGARIKRGAAYVTLTNASSGKYKGVTFIFLNISPDQSFADGTEIATVRRSFNLKPGASKTFKIKIASLPETLNGNYYLLAQCQDSSANTSAVVSTGPIAVGPPQAVVKPPHRVASLNTTALERRS